MLLRNKVFGVVFTITLVIVLFVVLNVEVVEEEAGFFHEANSDLEGRRCDEISERMGWVGRLINERNYYCLGVYLKAINPALLDNESMQLLSDFVKDRSKDAQDDYFYKLDIAPIVVYVVSIGAGQQRGGRSVIDFDYEAHRKWLLELVGKKSEYRSYALGVILRYGSADDRYFVAKFFDNFNEKERVVLFVGLSLVCDHHSKAILSGIEKSNPEWWDSVKNIDVDHCK